MPTVVLGSDERVEVPLEWCQGVPLLREMLGEEADEKDELPIPIVERREDLELVMAITNSLGKDRLSIDMPLSNVRDFASNVRPPHLAQYVKNLSPPELVRVLRAADYLAADSVVHLVGARIAFDWARQPDADALRATWGFEGEPRPVVPPDAWGQR